MKCQYCGCDIPDGSAYCNYCGSKIEDQKIYCRECGSPLTKESEVCGQCGATVKPETSELSTQKTANSDTSGVQNEQKIAAEKEHKKGKNVSKASSGKKTKTIFYAEKKKGIKIKRIFRGVLISIFTLFSLILISNLVSEFFPEIKSEIERGYHSLLNAGKENASRNSEIETDEKEEKNGFDLSKNKQVSVGNYKFSVPKYLKAAEKETDLYKAYAEKSGKYAWLQIVSKYEEQDSVSFKRLQRETWLGIRPLSYKLWFTSTGRVKFKAFDNGSIKGYIYTCSFTHDFDGTEYQGNAKCFVFPSEENNSWVFVSFMETDNTEYSYFGDFEQILNSIIVKGSFNEHKPFSTETSTVKK
ncbi:MAG: zinc ribbon domain-containing protein [Clostridiales bacterium]|nr:zinc ribbon domain-containing protein [Clostridiales bacterium]